MDAMGIFWISWSVCACMLLAHIGIAHRESPRVSRLEQRVAALEAELAQYREPE